MSNKTSASVRNGVVVACLLTLLGCGQMSTSQKGRAQETSHLRSIISLYNYAAQVLGHAPADEAEFKQFIGRNGTKVLERLKITNVNDLLTSERDGEPFVVLYGDRPTGVSKDVIAYERTGVDGKHEIGFELGMIQEVDESRLAELVPSTSTTDAQK